MPTKTDDFSAEFYHEADLRLIQLVPETARRILDLDCGPGHFGEVLKHTHPERYVIGLCADASNTENATRRLDHVIDCNIETSIPDLSEAPFDCIVAANIFEYLPAPEATLQQLRAQLAPDGCLVAAIPNSQHWSMIDALYRGDFQPRETDGQPRKHRQNLCFANIIKCFLDAGFLPRIKDRRNQAAPSGWLESATPLAHFNGLDAETFAARTQTHTFFIEATPIANLPTASNTPPPSITIGVCTNDRDVLRDNLLASPCLQTDAHEVLIIEGASSAAEGLNAAIEQASHPLIVLVHQDVYLPRWWISRLWQQYQAAHTLSNGKVGIMGVFGVRGTPNGIIRSGCVVDREFLLAEPTPLPAQVGSLDELILIIPRASPVRFDPGLGFHLYGTDACLSAEESGFAALTINAPCFHNSKQGNALPEAFARSANTLREKWKTQRPIATPCAVIS